MSSLTRGRIIWVKLVDPRGRNPKVRPAVVLSSTEEVDSSGVALVAAITSEVGLATRDTVVELPWHRDGHPRTKLRERSEVVCTWLARVPVSTIVGFSGTVPADRLMQVLAKVAALSPSPPPPPDEAQSSEAEGNAP